MAERIISEKFIYEKETNKNTETATCATLNELIEYVDDGSCLACQFGDTYFRHGRKCHMDNDE